MSHGNITQAIADVRAGKLVIVADDETRENEATWSAPPKRSRPR